jgi:site-specific DNA-methyltransferase (adenine-specific)
VWNFSGESKNRIGHPAPFPVELPRRCIKLFSYVEDIVLDPFLGSGTTLIACLETSRAGIGVDINKKYCDLAVKRLREHGVFQKRLLETI